VNVQRVAALVRPLRIERRKAFGHDGVLELVALDVECHEAVDPRRLDASPGAVGVLVPNDPSQAGVDRGLAERGEAELLIQMQEAIREQE
jgi:hypothetical protein